MSQLSYRNLSRTIFSSTLLVGTLEAVAEIIQYFIRGGRHPENLARYNASMIFGREASPLGIPAAAWGIIFHYLIILLFTLLFFVLYARIGVMKKNVAATSLVYAIFIWIVMKLVVIPASFAPSYRFNPEQAIISIGMLTLCIGLPLSLMAKKHYLYKK